jgi:TPR repeat protein
MTAMTDPSWPPAVTFGLDALDRHEYALARDEFEKAIEEGHSGDFLVNFGWLLEQGLGGDADIPRAVALYRKALIDQPMGYATFHLGMALMKHGDRGEGAELLQKDAEAGNPSAAYWLYALSSDTQDPESAALSEKCLLRAAELGHAFALRDLARRRVNSSKGLSKVPALLGCWKAKAWAIALMFRDINDRRVR